MFPIAKAILKGALQRDECRGAHYKPAFEYPGLKSTTEAEKKIEAEQWCDRFAANTAKWLKSTIAVKGQDGDTVLTYEDVDTSLIPPRPRLYGLVGAELIEQAWKNRAAQAAVTPAGVGSNANGAAAVKTPTVNA